MKRMIAVLPARLSSKRLTQKPLVEVAGKPLIWHAWQQAVQAQCFSRVIVATDSELLIDLVESWGGEAIVTSHECHNGTERVASIAEQLDTEFIVNIQADMPRIEKSLLHRFLADWNVSQAEVFTPIYRLRYMQDVLDANQVKAVVDSRGAAIYFSRQPIPFVFGVPIANWLEHAVFWGHVGIYAYTTRALKRYVSSPPCQPEIAESLEQLRFLDLGMTIATYVTQDVPIRVDTMDDLRKAREHLGSVT